MEEYMHAIPCGNPPIIKADKVEEFLNMRPNEELKEKRKKRLEKFNKIVVDNTKIVGGVNKYG